jgi:NIMA-interacting peptidyl-prolyl cis-trans isomerase 1
MSGSRGVLYFYYSEIRQSAWDLPADVSEAAVKTLPGHAEHIAGDGDKHTQVHRHILLVKHVGSLRPSSWKEVRPLSGPASPPEHAPLAPSQ